MNILLLCILARAAAKTAVFGHGLLDSLNFANVQAVILYVALVLMAQLLFEHMNSHASNW